MNMSEPVNLVFLKNLCLTQSCTQ